MLSVLSLDFTTHILMLFLFEGQKILFRLIYALLKLNVDFLLCLKMEGGVENKEEWVIKKIKDHCSSKVTLANLLSNAFEVQIKTKQTLFQGVRLDFEEN